MNRLQDQELFGKKHSAGPLTPFIRWLRCQSGSMLFAICKRINNGDKALCAGQVIRNEMINEFVASQRGALAILGDVWGTETVWLIRWINRLPNNCYSKLSYLSHASSQFWIIPMFDFNKNCDKVMPDSRIFITGAPVACAHPKSEFQTQQPNLYLVVVTSCSLILINLKIINHHSQLIQSKGLSSSCLIVGSNYPNYTSLHNLAYQMLDSKFIKHDQILMWEPHFVLTFDPRGCTALHVFQIKHHK